MARIFTTRFEFNGQLFDAMVTITSRGSLPSITVRVLDASLFELVPGGVLQYNGFDGYRHLPLIHENPLVQNLVEGLAQSVMMQAERSVA